MLDVDLPPTPSYPASLPGLRFLIDLRAEASALFHGAPVALRAGDRSFEAAGWVDGTLGDRVASVRLGLGRVPFEALTGALAALWGPAPFAGKTRHAWVDAVEAPTFRACARIDQGDVSLVFGPVQPLARYFDVLEAALRGDPVLPRVGATREAVEAAFPGALVSNGTPSYCVSAPLVCGEYPLSATVDFDGDGLARAVRWYGGAGLLDATKPVEKAIAALAKRHGAALLTKHVAKPVLVDGVEVQLGSTVKPASGAVVATFRAPGAG